MRIFDFSVSDNIVTVFQFYLECVAWDTNVLIGIFGFPRHFKTPPSEIPGKGTVARMRIIGMGCDMF